MTDEQAQSILDDGHCPKCEAPLCFGEEPDDNDGIVFWRSYAECTGSQHHRYPTQYDGGGTYSAIWEEEE